MRAEVFLARESWHVSSAEGNGQIKCQAKCRTLTMTEAICCMKALLQILDIGTPFWSKIDFPCTLPNREIFRCM